jgi:hypothetical protein
MCSCGIAKMCVDPSKNCNCDAIVPVDLVDEGNIGKQNRIYFIERVSNMFWILNRCIKTWQKREIGVQGSPELWPCWAVFLLLQDGLVTNRTEA